MSQITTPDSAAGTHDLVVTRTFDAPIERVWQAWTDGAQVRRWWGPSGFTAPVAEMDVRVGGRSLVAMRAPEAMGGRDMYNTWTYTEVTPPTRLAFVLRFSDPSGAAVDPATMGLPPGVPPAVPHVVTFAAVAPRRTEMTVTERGYTTEQARDISKLGLDQVLDKMAASVAQP